MTPEQNELQQRPDFTFPCANCGSNSAAYDSASKLCADCRRQFVRYPIPLWIKGFGLAISLILVLALTKLPNQISIGLSLERGKQAMTERNYMTAQRHLEDFTTQVPESEDGQANLMIASFYNQDWDKFNAAWEHLEGKTVEDDDLYNEVNSVMNLADNYFPSDAFDSVLAHYNNNSDEVPDTAYENFLKGSVNEIYAMMSYAKILYYNDEYEKSDSVLKRILRVDDDYMPAYIMLSYVKRDEDSLNMSLKYCDKAFALNNEYAEAMCTKARTLLKLKKDKEALELAEKAYVIDPLEDHIQATLALAYHYNKQNKLRDDMLQSALKKDTAADGYAQFVKDIIEGKVEFRK